MTSRDLDGKESGRALTKTEANGSAFGVAARRIGDDAPMEPMPSAERPSRPRPRRATELRGPGLEFPAGLDRGLSAAANGRDALRAQESLRRQETQAYGEALKTTPKAPPVPRPGESFGNYSIVCLLAQGGTSEVYQALHVGLKKQVALKVLRSDFAQYEEAKQDFLREGENAASIRHPHIVDVTDLGEVDGLPFIVMELLIGQDLSAIYREQAPLAVPHLVDLMLPIIFATSAGHAQGVVHGDLKPGNVFLHRQGQRVVPKLLDFGLSRRIHERRSASSARVFGTPHYMAPEQARGERGADELTDQYALGVMLYEGATARLPHDAEEPGLLLQRVGYEPFVPSSQLASLPEAFEAVILQLMDAHRGARFRTLLDAVAALIPFATPSAQPFWWRELSLSARASVDPEAAPDPEPTLVVALDPGPSLPPPAPQVRERHGEARPGHIAPEPRRSLDAASYEEPSLAFNAAPSTAPPASGSQASDDGDTEPRLVPDAGTDDDLLPAVQVEMDTVQAEIEEEPADPSAGVEPVADVEFEEVAADAAYTGPPVAIIAALAAAEVAGEQRGDLSRWRRMSATDRSAGDEPLDFADGYDFDAHLAGLPAPLWRRPGVWVMLAGVLAASISWSRLIRYESPAPPTTMTAAASSAIDPGRTPVLVEVEPASAVLELDGVQVGVGSYRGSVARDGQVHRLRALCPGFQPETVEFSEQPPPQRLRLRLALPTEEAQASRNGPPQLSPGRGPAGASRGPNLGVTGEPRHVRSVGASPLDPQRTAGAQRPRRDGVAARALRPPSLAVEREQDDDGAGDAPAAAAGEDGLPGASAAQLGGSPAELEADVALDVQADLEPSALEPLEVESGGKPQVQLIEGRKQPMVQVLE